MKYTEKISCLMKTVNKQKHSSHNLNIIPIINKFHSERVISPVVASTGNRELTMTVFFFLQGLKAGHQTNGLALHCCILGLISEQALEALVGNSIA